MNFRHGLIALLLVLGAGAAMADSEYPISTSVGVVEDIDLAAGLLIIEGLRYSVAVDAEVQIAGSYGAFSMLLPGMKVLFIYRRIALTEREIIQIRQIPPSVNIEQASRSLEREFLQPVT